MGSFVQAQSFVPQADTVWGNANTGGMTNLPDTIAVPATVSLKWRVLETDFPTDWLPEMTLGICDASLCRQNTAGQLWNGTFGTTFTCTYPGLNNSHDFHLQINLVGASGGTHYLTVRVDDNATSLSRKMTFILNNGTTSVAAVNAGFTGLGVFPNPARVATKVLFTLAEAGRVKCDIFDMAGRKVMSREELMSAGRQSMEIATADMPAGMYNAVLTTAKGMVTERFAVAW